MVLVAVGMALGLLPLADEISLDPQDHRDPGRARHRVHRAGLADGRRPRASTARSTCPVVALVAHLVAGVAAAAGHHAADHPRHRRCSAGGWPGWRRPSRCSWAPRWPRPTRCSPPTCRSASRSPRTSTDPTARTRPSRRRGRRHPLRAHRRGRAQRRPRLPLRAPGAAPARRRLRPRSTRAPGSAGTSSARSRSASASALAGRLAARPPGVPLAAATSSGWPTTASPCWRWPRCWRRTAPRSSSAATASSRCSPAR